jgi:GTP cyclohydrolase IA
MQDLYKKLLEELGEDVNREGLQKTPERAAKAFQYLTRGYDQSVDEVINGAIFESDMDEMVIVKGIELYSICEHHLLPFFGKCHVAYIPNGKIIGLSKIARIVDLFSSRLQLQENLTMQVADTILKYTGAEGVGVVVEARHLCMMMRGAQKQNSVMTTSCMLGSFRKDQATRSEFLSLIKAI